MVTGSNLENLVSNVENCIKKHIEYLNERGMVTNISKTKIVVFGTDTTVKLKIGDQEITSGDSMKVLSVVFESKMKWSKQIELSISRGRRLRSDQSFICLKLNRDQFINSVQI